MVKKPITTPNFDDSPTTGAANQEAGSAKANKPASPANEHKAVKVTPAYTSKPERELKQVTLPAESEPLPCPQCGAPLVSAIGSGDAATEIVRCGQCGYQNPTDLPLAAGVVELGKKEEAKVTRESLNKVVTNDQTPRCAFCSSVRIERMPNANFLKWRCNDCRRHFREPVKARRSA